jgi:hypothetical protein
VGSRLIAELKAWTWREELEEGQMMLRGHGIAYRRLSYDRTVAMVIPLNVVWAWTRRFYLFLRFQAPGGAVWFDDKLAEAYYLGIRETHEKYN